MENTPSFVSDVQLSYKPSTQPTVRITSTQMAADACRALISEDQVGLREFFGVLLLNRGNWIIGQSLLFAGGVTTVFADPKHIFQCAILANASSIVIFHNHPSGNMRASESDRATTAKIAAICKLLNIDLLDHIILSGMPGECSRFFSFAEEGLL